MGILYVRVLVIRVFVLYIGPPQKGPQFRELLTGTCRGLGFSAWFG